MVIGIGLAVVLIAGAVAGWYGTRSNPAPPVPGATTAPVSPAATPDSPASSPVAAAPTPISTTPTKTSPPAAVPAPAATTPAKAEPAPSNPDRQPEPAPVAAAAAADDAGDKEEDSVDTGPDDAKAPPAAKKEFDIASGLLNQDKYAESVPHFDQALKVYPAYVNALLGRANARRRMNQFEPSVADCSSAIKLGREEPRGYFCLGQTYLFMKQWDNAIKQYTETIRLKSGFSLAYEGRANALVNLSQYQRAVDDFTLALRSRKSNPLYMRRAFAYMQLGQYEKAIQDYDEAIALRPNMARGYNMRANAEQKAGKGGRAAADRKKARELKQ